MSEVQYYTNNEFTPIPPTKLSKYLLKKVDEGCDVVFMVIPQKALSTKAFFDTLYKYRKVNFLNPQPIVFIAALNNFENFDLLGEVKSTDFEKRTKAFTLDKRINFLDSSIWHYYLPLEKWNDNTFEENLTDILITIKNNCDNKLYKLVVSKEYLEFQSRMMKNSYLKDIGGGHSEHIAPFMFHSETKMKFNADKLLDQLKSICGKEVLQWNVLLIDDYAEVNLKPFTQDNNVNCTKKDIILEILKNDIAELNGRTQELTLGFQYDTTPQKNVLIDVENKIKNIDINGNKTDKKSYDLILLDYLLGKNTETHNREYGSDFFIKNYFKKLRKFKSPMGKFWVFPITAFSKAMNDRIKEEGIDHIDENWYLFDGADPIATPELFRYNLFKILILQLKQAIVTKNDILENLTQDNFKLEEGNAMNVRFVARGKYGAFIQKFGVYEFLILDKKNHSAFATSILKYIDSYRSDDIDFYKNVRKLLYLVGYGSQGDKRRIINLLKKVEQQLPRVYNIEEDNFKEPIDIVKNFENFQKSIKELKLDDDDLIKKIENLCNDVLKHLPNKYSLDSIKKLTIKDKLHHEILEFAKIINYSKANIDLLNSITGVILIEYKRKEDLLVFFRGIIDYTNKL